MDDDAQAPDPYAALGDAQLAELADTMLDCVGAELEAAGYPDVRRLMAVLTSRLRAAAEVLDDMVMIPQIDLQDMARWVRQTEGH